MKLGQRIDVPVFELGTDAKPDEIAAQGVAQAKKVRMMQLDLPCRILFQVVLAVGRHRLQAGWMSTVADGLPCVAPCCLTKNGVGTAARLQADGQLA